MAFRVDIGGLRPVKRLANGNLRADAFLTRTGVFLYRNPDGTERREYRPPEEVFKADALEGFAMTPVTNDHPPEMVTSANARQFAVGTTGERVVQDGDRVRATIVVYDADTIAKMESGKVQVSCGYQVDLEDSPGVSPQGEKYDVIQRNIRGNHVAIVESGRAGSDVRVRMDASYMIPGVTPETGKKVMDEKLQKTLEDLAQTRVDLAAEKARADKAEADILTEKARADKAEGERDSEKARADDSEKARTDEKDSFSSRVQARVSLEKAAEKVLGEDLNKDATDRAIKVSVVKKLDSFDIPEDKSDDYVDARYDGSIARADAGSEALGELRTVTGTPKADGTTGNREADARAAMLKRNQEAFKTDLGAN